MLKEYAVEPAVMGSTWVTFRYLIELLAFEQGRRISRFPNIWERLVIEAATASGMGAVKLASVVERLKRARERGSIVKFGRAYSPALGGWFDNALAQHRRRPFHAIIAEANPQSDVAVVVLDDVDETHALIRSMHSWEVPRTAEAIADVVAPLIYSAKEILIVDPFIDWRDVPQAQRYRDFLRALLDRLATQGRASSTIQLHYRTADARPPIAQIRANAQRWLNGLLPAGFSLELHEWRERPNGEDFHDRHVLCDCGGLSIGPGFEAVGPHQNARVTLEAFELTQRLKDRFTLGKQAFDLVGRVVVLAADGTTLER